MAAAHKILTFPTEVLTTILNGESLYCDFDLTSLFGKTIDTTDYTDVKIYLYHKFSKNNIGFDATHEYWGNVDLNITITGVLNDQARILVTEGRTDDIMSGHYKFMISLEDLPIFEKISNDAFVVNYAIDEI